MCLLVRRLWSVYLLALLIEPVATAHHSTAYYSDELTELTGELVEVGWRNPHVNLIVRTISTNGEEERWVLEAGPPYMLQRRGIAQGLFGPGQRVVIAGRPHASDTRMLAQNVLLGDGREVVLAASATPHWSAEAIGLTQRLEPVDVKSEGRGIYRVWSETATRRNTLPFRVAPSSEENVERIAWLNGFAARCEPMGMPGIMSTPYPIELIDRGATIQLLSLSNNATIDRVIHLRAPADPLEQPRSPRGYSLGEWEDVNTLTVRTSRIDWPYFDDDGSVPQSADVEVIERFALSDDQSRLTYEMSVTDLLVFTRPNVVTINKTYSALGERLSLPSCGE